MNFTNEKLFKILKDNIILILACGVLCFGIAYAYSKFFVKPVYFSESKIMIESDRLSTIDSTAELNLARQMVYTYIEILDSNDFYSTVYDSLPADVRDRYTVTSLKDSSTLTIQDETEIIKVSFKCQNKDDAQLVTSAIVSNIDSYFNLSSKYNTSVWITESAKAASVSEDKTVLLSVIGLLFGMALIYIIEILREALDIRVKTVKDLVERYDLPVLGSIPAFKGKVIKKEDGFNGRGE